MDTGTTRKDLSRELELQWGHGRKAMDTSLRMRGHPAGRRASMGPWPQSHGYRSRRAAPSPLRRSFNGAMAAKPWILGADGGRCSPALLASMGPWPQSHGYHCVKVVLYLCQDASMGPWPQSHGYTAITIPRCDGGELLQWGHGRKAMDTRFPLDNDPSPLSFNGAMAAKPWIRGR